MAKELHELNQLEERVILVAVEMDERNSRSAMETEACLDELEELVKTAGATAVARSIQKRERIHPGHYLGTGKIEEVKAMVAAYNATGIVCDDELSPAQLKNLEQMLDTKVMDRTMVILDIFAARALSGEGKIQVELAQLKYRLSRLVGIGASMSRLGGGIGTRGPGETKLETDRRYIKERIAELNREAQDIRTHRELLRAQRSKKGTPVISLVGYTNAGKSTILNYLSDAEVLAEDKLFATLDTTTRKVELPGGSEIFLTDTVGFIQKLPHHLVQAFRATLEELQYADILLHVVDASNPNRTEHMKVVYETLKSLGCENTPVLTVFNKMDNDVELPLPMDTMARDIVQVSAWKGDGMDTLLERIEKLLQSFRKSMAALVPYTEGSLIGWVHGRCEIIREEHTGEGVLLEVYVDEESANRLAKFKVEE
ncbi:MAG: GTPase HflX [Anaerotignum sp.]|nr:GTPase HflX [Anaerotignum sp.]